MFCNSYSKGKRKKNIWSSSSFKFRYLTTTEIPLRVSFMLHKVKIGTANHVNPSCQQIANRLNIVWSTVSRTVRWYEETAFSRAESWTCKY